MNGSKTNIHVGLFAVAFIMALLASQSASAQAEPIPGLSPKEKTALAEKKAQDNAADKAYNSSLKNIPNPNKSVDPWGSMRTPNNSGNK